MSEYEYPPGRGRVVAPRGSARSDIKHSLRNVVSYLQGNRAVSRGKPFWIFHSPINGVQISEHAILLHICKGLFFIIQSDLSEGQIFWKRGLVVERSISRNTQTTDTFIDRYFDDIVQFES